MPSGLGGGATGGRVAAVEVMLNTQLVSDLIESGDLGGVRDAMEKSMAEGSQTFDEDLARLVNLGLVSKDEGLAYADSPTNLMWRMQNDFTQKAQAAAVPNEEEEGASFTEITLDVKH